MKDNTPLVIALIVTFLMIVCLLSACAPLDFPDPVAFECATECVVYDAPDGTPLASYPAGTYLTRQPVPLFAQDVDGWIYAIIDGDGMTGWIRTDQVEYRR